MTEREYALSYWGRLLGSTVNCAIRNHGHCDGRWWSKSDISGGLCACRCHADTA